MIVEHLLAVAVQQLAQYMPYQWLKPQMGAVELVFWKVEQPVIELTTLNSTTARKKKNSCSSQPPSKPATESSFVVPAILAPMEFFAFLARTSTPN
jgi:hypothetical protein